MLGRIDIQALTFAQHFACEGIDLGHTLNLISKKFNAYRYILIGGKYLQNIAAHTEASTNEIGIVTLILNFCQVP